MLRPERPFRTKNLQFFTIAIATTLREGDICTLKWSEIDFKLDLIVKRMRKTDNMVEIPIMPPLRFFLLLLQSDVVESEYVLPQHAEMYLNNSSGVSYRIKQFLENKCHIATTKKLEGRSCAVSVKDLHSCRHTFCYYAGLYGMMLSGMEARDFEAADREELQALISTLPIEKVRQLLEELR